MTTRWTWTFELAAAFWRIARENPEPVWDQYESAETFILQSRAESLFHVATMLDVIVENSCPRSDGLDMKALKRASLFLKNQTQRAERLAA